MGKKLCIISIVSVVLIAIAGFVVKVLNSDDDSYC